MRVYVCVCVCACSSGLAVFKQLNVQWQIAFVAVGICIRNKNQMCICLDNCMFFFCSSSIMSFPVYSCYFVFAILFTNDEVN